MQQVPLTAQLRAETGKGPNRRLRASGNVPAILYGQEVDPVNIALNEHDFEKTMVKVGGELVMFDLTVKEADISGQLAVIREAQRDPVSERLVHIDFMRVDKNKPIDVHIAVRGHGNPVGVQEGGILEQITRQIHIRCLPDLIPAQFDLDYTSLEVGQAIHVSDLEVDEGVQILTPENFVIFHVVIPRIEEEPVAEEEELAEGEVAEGAEGAEESADADAEKKEE